MPLLLEVLVMLVLVGVAYWAMHYAAASFGLPAQVITVVDIVLVVVTVIWLIRLLGLWPAVAR